MLMYLQFSLSIFCQNLGSEFLKVNMDPMWTPYIQSPERDDWRGIEDAGLRKRVQNRLAQRAHRKQFPKPPTILGMSTDVSEGKKFGRKPAKPKRAPETSPQEQESQFSKLDSIHSPGYCGRSQGGSDSTQASVLADFDPSNFDPFASIPDGGFSGDLFSSLIENSIPFNSIQFSRSPRRTERNTLASSFHSNPDFYLSPTTDTHCTIFCSLSLSCFPFTIS